MAGPTMDGFRVKPCFRPNHEIAMSRRKKPPSKNHPAIKPTATSKPVPKSTSSTIGSGTDSSNTDALGGPPSLLTRRMVTVLVVVHLVAIASSMLAVVGSSQTQADINRLLRPYTMATHFRTQGEPVFLASGESIENPHRLQILKSSRPDADLPNLEDDSDWVTIEPQGIGGFAANDRYSRLMGTVQTLVENLSPSLVAELLLPEVRQDPSIVAVRVIRLPTVLSLDEESQPEAIYLAAVSRAEDAVALIEIDEFRLRTMNLDGSSPGTSKSAADGGSDE